MENASPSSTGIRQEAEQAARREGGEHQIAPAQRVADFVAGRASGSLPRTSYIPGITPSRLDEWMPGFIAQGLRQGIATFGRRMRGFVTNEAVVVGVESRTSSPVRIPRERPPVVVLDEGPLILVETRKDLSLMQLPFEKEEQATGVNA